MTDDNKATKPMTDDVQEGLTGASACVASTAAGCTPVSVVCTPMSARAKTFSRIQTDLRSALDQWDTLSAQAPALSADEQRFQEMQQLLKDLHTKMKELNFI